MSMLMCWQWFLLQREAVLLNPNSPGTERILSSALTAVYTKTATFCSHPTAHALPLFSVLQTSSFLSIFPNVQERHVGEAVPPLSGGPFTLL